MTYLVQAIIISSATGMETVTASIKTTDWKKTLDRLQFKNRNCNSYKYGVLEIETDTVILLTTNNEYYNRLWN